MRPHLPNKSSTHCVNCGVSLHDQNECPVPVDPFEPATYDAEFKSEGRDQWSSNVFSTSRVLTAEEIQEAYNAARGPERIMSITHAQPGTFEHIKHVLAEELPVGMEVEGWSVLHGDGEAQISFSVRYAKPVAAQPSYHELKALFEKSIQERMAAWSYPLVSKYGQGFTIEPKGQLPDIDVDPPVCRCDMKDLLSDTGHSSGCPEKKR